MRSLLKFAACAALAICAATAAPPDVFKQDIFPMDKEHNHASAIVELPNGDLMVCWYRGSGERTADDVRVMAARKKKGAAQWGAPYVLADVPGFPDTNPVIWIDSKKRLWFFWQTIVANQWETAVTQVRISSDYMKENEPKWDISQALFLRPEKMTETVEKWAAQQPEIKGHALYDTLMKRAADKYFSRMGWMGRAHPFELPSGRILLPLYSDGYSFSLMAITDDGGKTFRASETIVGAGNIQPSIARRKDGTLVAYMRDNGPPPKRVLYSESKDNGETWTPARDTEIPNSGTGLEVMQLKDGRWMMINNDTERNRYSLALTISDDEGKTWKWTRHIELDPRAESPSSFHYPSITLGSGGLIHASYTVFLNDRKQGEPRKTIRYARFTPEWVEQGDPK